MCLWFLCVFLLFRFVFVCVGIVFVLLLDCCWCCFCCFCVFLFFKGQVRWPKGPPHLALNPPYYMCLLFLSFSFFVFDVCFCFLVCFAFLSLLLIEKPFIPHKRPFVLFIFCVTICFSLAFFGLPLFHFLFLCLSLVLIFLPCFLFLMSISGSCFLLLVCLLLFQDVL